MGDAGGMEMINAPSNGEHLLLAPAPQEWLSHKEFALNKMKVGRSSSRADAAADGILGVILLLT